VGRENNKSVPQVFTNGGSSRILMPSNASPPPPPKPKPKKPTKPGEVSFGVVYANDLAKTEIEKKKPEFPVGSIIIREKNLQPDSVTPEIVIAMVKRQKSFSKKTGDWEFFVFDGKDLRLKTRETAGNCAECHSKAKKTDWVFKDYLKKTE
jgi:hypothetical protein